MEEWDVDISDETLIEAIEQWENDQSWEFDYSGDEEDFIITEEQTGGGQRLWQAEQLYSL